MKRHLPLSLILVFALLAIGSCQQHRKSAEEGELFLKETLKKLTLVSDSLAYHQQQLFEAEQNYDFTLEQRIRLKSTLFSYFPTNDSLQEKQINEVEALAIQLGNDSIRELAHQNIFRYYLQANDVEKALRIFRLDEATLLARADSTKLNLYYVGLAFYYKKHFQADSALYWHLKTRSMNKHRLAYWYAQTSIFLFEAGRNDEALRYADSCLNDRPLNTLSKITAYRVKGKILTTYGHIPEALHLYADALHEIEAFRKKITKPSASPIIGYSSLDQLVIYQYAELMQQIGRIPEAIALLEKIVPHSNQHDQLMKDGFDWYVTRYKRGDHYFPQFLLATCYHSLGQTEKAIYYTHIGDSIQSTYIAYMWQKQRETLKTQSSNQYLATRIFVKEQEVKNARLMQYILWSAVALLLAVITAGLAWWRNRRRRLGQLFTELVRRHAEWMQMRALIAEAFGEAAPNHEDTSQTLPSTQPLALPPSADSSNASSGGAPADSQTNNRLYLSALRMMEEQKPFTDPVFDLLVLARLIGTNRTQLSTAINQQTHTSFSNWLAEYRVNYLIQQLDTQTDATIDQLYPTAGFAVRSTFYRQFRQVTGLTPKQYMKEKKEALTDPLASARGN